MVSNEFIARQMPAWSVWSIFFSTISLFSVLTTPVFPALLASQTRWQAIWVLFIAELEREKGSGIQEGSKGREAKGGREGRKEKQMNGRKGTVSHRLYSSKGDTNITEIKGLETPSQHFHVCLIVPMFTALWRKMQRQNNDAYALISATVSSPSHKCAHTHIDTHMFHTYLWTYTCIQTLYHTPHKAWRNNENLLFLRE